MYETRGSNKCSSSLRSGRVEPTSGALRSACCIASSHYRCYNIRMCSRPAGGCGVLLGPRPRAARSAAQPAPARRPGAGVTLTASVRSGRGDRWGCSIFTYVLAYILYNVYITQWESGTIRVNQRSASVACGNKQWQGAALPSRRKQGQPNELCNQGSLSGNQAQSVSISHRWQAVACRGNLTSYAFRPTQWE